METRDSTPEDHRIIIQLTDNEAFYLHNALTRALKLNEYIEVKAFIETVSDLQKKLRRHIKDQLL